MSTGVPLLVGAGPLPELLMREACTALADRWGLELSHQGDGRRAQLIPPRKASI